MKEMIRALLLATVAALSGCATIIGSPTHLMQVSSEPTEATVSITDEKGLEVFKGSTPASVTLKKSDGTYWGGKSYTVVVSKEGFEPRTIPLTTEVNVYYIGGNFVFGGLIGWFIIDPLGGHMYDLKPEAVSATLLPPAAPAPASAAGEQPAIRVSLRPALPARRTPSAPPE